MPPVPPRGSLEPSQADRAAYAAQVAVFGAMCDRFKQNLGPVMLFPGTFGAAAAISAQQHAVAVATNAAVVPPVLQFPHQGATDLAQYTMGEVWSLPQKQRVIVNWDDCMEGHRPAGMWNGYWANQCYAGEYSAAAKLASGFTRLCSGRPINGTPPPDPVTFTRPGIVGAVRAALSGRLMARGSDGLYGSLGAIPTQPTTFVTGLGGQQVPVGFYTLGVHATITPECGYPINWFLNEQATALDTLKSWFDTDQNNARNYLNIISDDYVEQSKLVADAIQMNQPAQD